MTSTAPDQVEFRRPGLAWLTYLLLGSTVGALSVLFAEPLLNALRRGGDFGPRFRAETPNISGWPEIFTPLGAGLLFGAIPALLTALTAITLLHPLRAPLFVCASTLAGAFWSAVFSVVITFASIDEPGLLPFYGMYMFAGACAGLICGLITLALR